MTIIWPTKNDVHLDDESGDAHIYRAKNLGNEALWSQFWDGIVPTSTGSWIPVAFGLDTTISLPTTTLTLKMVRGRAVINGFKVDFLANASPPEVNFEFSHGHVHLGLQLIYTGGFVSGYQWNQDLDLPVVRVGQIYVGQAIIENGNWKEWFPASYPEGWRMATGTYDTNKTPQRREVALGFQPITVKVSAGGKTIETYGFKLDADGLLGTYEATLFDKTT